MVNTQRALAIRKLQSVVKKEISSLSKLFSLTEEEHASVRALNSEKVEATAAARAALASQIEELQFERRELLHHFGAESDERLSDVVAERMSAAERRLMQPLVNELRTVAKKARGATKNFQQVSSFSLTMVGGLLSIISSARQGVSRAYRGDGVVSESTHVQSRDSNVLKKV